ncbi:transposase [Siccirubricoccus deserti]
MDHAVVVIDLAALPDDAQALRAIVLAQAAALAGQRSVIERLRLQLARLRRMQFGRSSERLSAEADQLELTLEELETEAPTAPPAEDPADTPARPERRKPARRPLPEHLPREVVEHGAEAHACAACGGALRVSPTPCAGVGWLIRSWHAAGRA